MSDHTRLTRIIVAAAAAAILLTACPSGSEAPATDTDIASFIFEAANNDALDADVEAEIGTDGAVAATVPHDTDVTGLVPTITIPTGSTVQPESGVAQDFTDQVTYTVTAEDGETSAEFTATVTVNESPPPEDLTPPADVALTVTQVGTGSFTIAWDEPSEEDYDHLLVSCEPGGSEGTRIGKGLTSHQYTNLTPGVDYTVVAKSVDTSGNASAGSSITLTVPAAEATAINGIDDLQTIREEITDLDAHTYIYVLTTSIDLTGVTWEPIGTEEDPFVGTFEGGGNSITGFSYDSTLNGYDPPEEVAFFGYIGREIDPPTPNGIVRNLHLSDVDLTGAGAQFVARSDSVAALAISNRGEISGCSSSGEIRGNGRYGQNAGLVITNHGSMQECWSSANVTAYQNAGGLICGNFGLVTDCYATGDVGPLDTSTTPQYHGGLISGASDQENCRVVDCYATGKVSGVQYVGGLIADCGGAEEILRCHASGEIIGLYKESTPTQYIGGLVGHLATTGFEGAELIECHATGAVTIESSTTDSGSAGGLVGYCSTWGTIHDCWAEGAVSGPKEIGGLIGTHDGALWNSFAVGDVSESFAGQMVQYAGGLVGALSGYAHRCFALGSVVVGEGNIIGGLVGINDGGVIGDSFARGDVTVATAGFSGYAVGGLVGHSRGEISRSYASGSVTGNEGADEMVGGLVGYYESEPIADCFYDAETTGYSTDGSSWTTAGADKSTAEMSDVATFTDTSTIGLNAAWDFVGTPNDDTATDDFWDIDASVNDGYPYLVWSE